MTVFVRYDFSNGSSMTITEKDEDKVTNMVTVNTGSVVPDVAALVDYMTPPDEGVEEMAVPDPANDVEPRPEEGPDESPPWAGEEEMGDVVAPSLSEMGQTPPPPGAFAQRKEIPAPLRAGMGFIRAAWMTIFSAFGFGITWLVDNYSSLSLPVWAGLAIGSIAYGIKKFLFPDTLI